jgi:hypothetical protein
VPMMSQRVIAIVLVFLLVAAGASVVLSVLL